MVDMRRDSVCSGAVVDRPCCRVVQVEGGGGRCLAWIFAPLRVLGVWGGATYRPPQQTTTSATRGGGFGGDGVGVGGHHCRREKGGRISVPLRGLWGRQGRRGPFPCHGGGQRHWISATLSQRTLSLCSPWSRRGCLSPRHRRGW